MEKVQIISPGFSFYVLQPSQRILAAKSPEDRKKGTKKGAGWGPWPPPRALSFGPMRPNRQSLMR